MAFLLPIARSRAELGIESLLDDFLELNSPVLKAILNTVQYLAANELQYLYAEQKHLEAYVAAHRTILGREAPQLVLGLVQLSKAVMGSSKLGDKDLTQTKNLISLLRSSLDNCYQTLKQKLLDRGWSKDPVSNRDKCFIGNVVWMVLTEEQGCDNPQGGITSPSVVGPLFSKAYKVVVVRCPDKSDKVMGHRLTSKRGKGLAAFNKDKDSKKRENHTRIFPASHVTPSRTEYDYHEPIPVSNMEERQGSMICHDIECVPLTSLMAESQEYLEPESLQSLVQQTEIPLTHNDIESNKKGVQDKLNRIASGERFQKPNAAPLQELQGKTQGALESYSLQFAGPSPTPQSAVPTDPQHLIDSSDASAISLDAEFCAQISKRWEELLSGILGIPLSIMGVGAHGSAPATPLDSASDRASVLERSEELGARPSNAPDKAYKDRVTQSSDPTPSLPPVDDNDLIISYEEIMQYQLRGPYSPDDFLDGLQPDEVQGPASPMSGGANDDSDTLHTPIASRVVSPGALQRVDTTITSATNPFAPSSANSEPANDLLKRECEDIEDSGAPSKRLKAHGSHHCNLTSILESHTIEGKSHDVNLNSTA